MFIHFGCWNKGGCLTPNKLSQVMNHLESEYPLFLSVCGDNYYPEKKNFIEKNEHTYTLTTTEIQIVKIEVLSL